MTPKQLRVIGQSMYGYGWQTRLADQLGVSPRTVRQWLSGDRQIPKPIEKLALILANRSS